jgi:hypothetical protein
MLIGLTGRAQAGKDTVYERARHIYGDRVQRRSFADALYNSSAATLGVSEECLREWKSDPDITVEVHHRVYGPIQMLSVRQYLQRTGTEAHRDLFGEDFWVDHLDLSHDPDTIVFVTDVRFDNEAQAIIDAGGYIVQVIGPETADDAHRSEAGVDPRLTEWVVDNSVRGAGFSYLDFQVRTILAGWGRH